MARYSSFLGQRVEVQYRASDTLVPASGVFVADSGRSIFLEQSFEQRGQHRYFRWEIPYQYLIKIALSKASQPQSVAETAPAEAPAESLAAEPPGESRASECRPPEGRAPESRAAGEPLVSRVAAGAGMGAGVLPLNKHSQPA
jgi:hypothetical protein